MYKLLLNLVLLLFFLSTNGYAQPFHPDKDGYIADPKFHQLIKNRGYELMAFFDTVSIKPLKITAYFQKGGEWGIMDRANASKLCEQ